MIFKDRLDAGRQLAKKLIKFKKDKSVVIIGLPRGGVILANEIAKELGKNMDIVVVRKIGVPMMPELALGAIAEDGTPVLDSLAIKSFKVSSDYLDKKITEEKKEIERRLKKYRGSRSILDLKGKTAIIVDDGIATGYTIQAAVISCKKKGAKKIIIATPVIAEDAISRVKQQSNKFIFIHSSQYFGAIGEFYEKFEQTSDKEVVDIMERNI